MKLMLIRDILGKEYTHGKLYVNNLQECFTLEDTDRFVTKEEDKIHGQTAIPTGTYSVEITHSERFNRLMPLVKGVPFFSGIRIHSGNTAADTEGCILVGKIRGRDRVLTSREAYQSLFMKLLAAQRVGESITLNVARAV